MIRIPREQYEAIVAHARQEAPREACGLLAGHGDRIERSIRSPIGLSSRWSSSLSAA